MGDGKAADPIPGSDDAVKIAELKDPAPALDVEDGVDNRRGVSAVHDDDAIARLSVITSGFIHT